MKIGETKADTFKHVSTYINERISGNNKQKSALKAGYSQSTSERPSLIEMTQTYGLLVQETLLDNQLTLRDTMKELREVIENKPVDWVKALNIAKVAEKQASIHNVLTPKVTIKETTDAKGNKIRTMWGSNAPTLRESGGNEEQ